MSVIYLKSPHERSRTEIAVDTCSDMSVQTLKSLVSEKVKIPLGQLTLMYGGRVLKSDNTLGHYQIMSGVTVFYMKRKEQTNQVFPTNQEESTSQLRRLVRNPRVHQILSRIMGNPMLLTSLIRGTPLENHPGIQSLINEAGTRTYSDTEDMISMFESNPEEAAIIEEVLQAIGAAAAEERGCGQDQIGDEDIVDMLEQTMQEGMEFLDGEGIQGRGGGDQGLADAQEQMYQHSQDILPHQQSQMSSQQSMEIGATPPPQLIRQNSSSTQHPTAVSPGITQNMLASALASVSPPSSEPTSLPSTSSRTSFRQPPLPSMSGPSSLSSSLTYGREEGSSSGPSSLPGRSSSQPGSGGVSPMDLQMALQSVVTSPPAERQSHHRDSSHRSHRSGRHHRYRHQLHHLHSMGVVSDDAACLHALEATNGDINAALELLLSEK